VLAAAVPSGTGATGMHRWWPAWGRAGGCLLARGGAIWSWPWLVVILPAAAGGVVASRARVEAAAEVVGRRGAGGGAARGIGGRGQAPRRCSRITAYVPWWGGGPVPRVACGPLVGSGVCALQGPAGASVTAPTATGEAGSRGRSGAEQGRAADCQQPPLRCGCRQQLTPSVRRLKARGKEAMLMSTKSGR